MLLLVVLVMMAVGVLVVVVVMIHTKVTVYVILCLLYDAFCSTATQQCLPPDCRNTLHYQSHRQERRR